MSEVVVDCPRRRFDAANGGQVTFLNVEGPRDGAPAIVAGGQFGLERRPFSVIAYGIVHRRGAPVTSPFGFCEQAVT